MSYSIIIADDEPLVLVGLQSMLDYSSLDCEIVAQARNGSQLEEAIEKYNPDIVITDIRMPIKTGLDVLKEAKEKNRDCEFILLTSYEEFEYVKSAISLDAVEYLVKLELSVDTLKAAIEKAKKRIESKRGKSSSSSFKDSKQIFRDRFFIRQFFQLGENETPLAQQIKNLGLELDDAAFTVSYITFPSVLEMEDKDKAISLCYSASALFQETVSRYIHCYTTVLDLGHAAITLCYEEAMVAGYRSHAYTALKTARESVESFFSLDSYISTGTIVNDIRLLSESFMKARALANKTGENNPIIFADHTQYKDTNEEKVLESSNYKEELKKAFSEVDAHTLEDVLSDIAKTLREKEVSRLSAISISSDVLYMVMTLLPDGEWMLDEIFPPSSPSAGYRILYQLRSASECAAWLDKLKEGVVKILSERKQDYRLQAISKIQSYINENITRRLSLGEIADIFGYSQGYLSSLFSKYAGINFVDYVTNARIQKAKELMASNQVKVYEVASDLGFESSFYFSKVFKKVTGMSPSDYLQLIQKE